MLALRATASLLLPALVLACHTANIDAPADAALSSSPAAMSAPPTPPLTGDWIIPLAVPAFEESQVAVPLGATNPRPLIIGVHGMRDRPEWSCGEWRAVTPYPFILCPHGQPLPGSAGLTFTNAATTGAEIEAGLTALLARFGSRVAEGPMVYAGFSRGAFMGVPLLVAHPARFPRAVLGEGGQGGWTEDAAKRYAEGGGKRLLFVCTTFTCEAATRPALARLERAGVKARMVSAGNIGHGFDGRAVEAIKPVWPWLVEGDPRFEAP